MVTSSSNQHYLKSKTEDRVKNGGSGNGNAPPIAVCIDKSRIRKQYRTYLDEFRGYERSNGASEGAANQHRDMVVTCIGVLEKHRDIIFERIGKNDLDLVRTDLEGSDVNHASSYIRVFAVFLSFITGTEPIIDTGRYGVMAGNRHLLLSKPDGDGERRREGSPEERADIEHRFGYQLDSFTGYEASEKVGYTTRAIHRKNVVSCIYVLERKHLPVVLSEIDEKDIAYLRDYLEDFGIDEPARRVNIFVKFLAFVTGSDPIVEQKRSLSHRGAWPSWFKTDFRFGKELESYCGMQKAKGNTPATIEGNRSKIHICCGILETVRSGYRLRDVDSEMLDSLREVLEETYTRERSSNYVSTVSDFIQYITGNDPAPRERSGYRITLDIETESDERFVEHLREYIGFMTEWGYKDHTIRSRISMNTVCYRKLKEIEGDFDLKDIDAIDIRRLRNEFRGYSESTVRQNLYAFGWFIEHVTGYNPCEEAKLIFNGGTETRQFIFSEDWTTIYEKADVMGRLILALGATMGLRRKEILGITMDDIQGDRIRIRGKGVGADGKVVVLPMTELVRRDLDEYLAVRAQLLSIFGDRSHGSLFINMTKKNVGKALQIRSFEMFLDGLQEKSGVSFTSHCLRRFFCTTMSDAGVDLDTIRRMMRHSSLETTLKCYLHADPRKMAGAVSKINDVFATMTNRANPFTNPFNPRRFSPFQGCFHRISPKIPGKLAWHICDSYGIRSRIHIDGADSDNRRHTRTSGGVHAPHGLQGPDHAGGRQDPGDGELPCRRGAPRIAQAGRVRHSHGRGPRRGGEDPLSEHARGPCGIRDPRNRTRRFRLLGLSEDGVRCRHPSRGVHGNRCHRHPRDGTRQEDRQSDPEGERDGLHREDPRRVHRHLRSGGAAVLPVHGEGPPIPADDPQGCGQGHAGQVDDAFVPGRRGHEGSIVSRTGVDPHSQ